MLREDPTHALDIPNVRNARDQFRGTQTTRKIEVQIKQARFVLVHANQLGRTVLQNLPAKFRSNRPSRAGDEYDATRDLLLNRFQIDPRRLAIQEVFQIDFSKLSNADLSGDDVFESGHGLKGNA